MEAEEDDDMIVVIVEEKDGVMSADGFPLEIKEEALEEYESNEVNDIIETAERYGEHIEVGIKLEEEDYETIEEDVLSEIEEYSMDDENDKDNSDEEGDIHRRRSWKKLRPSEYKSYIKELKKQHPTYITDKDSLVQHLVEQMEAMKPPAPPRDFFRVHDIDLLYECMKCSKLMSKLPETVRHYQEHHGPRYLICYACGVDFRSKTNLYKHEKRCAAPDIALVLRARARSVGRKGRRRPFLDDYAATPRPKLSENYKCEQCPAVFITKTGLTSHEHMHRGERPYKCPYPVCGVAYTSKSALSRHDYSKHRNLKFICDHCGRDFNMKHALVTHMDTHLPQKKFACPYRDCDRRFANRMHLNIHIDGQHKNLPPPCVCELCPRRFVRMSLLKVHMKKAHGMILMTRTMFFKSLPKLTETQVQHAKIFHELDLANRRAVDDVDGLKQTEHGACSEEGSQDGAVLLREDTGEFLPRISQKGTDKVKEEVAEAADKQDGDINAYIEKILNDKCQEIAREGKVVVIENGEDFKVCKRKKDYERLTNVLKEVPDIGESMPEI